VLPIQNKEKDQHIDKYDLSAITVTHITFVVGDFNGHWLMWNRYQTEDDCCKELEQWAKQTGMIGVNSGEPTKCISNSTIDISFYHESLSLLVDWCTLEDHCSDHLPVQLSFIAGTLIPRCILPVWCYTKADWS